MVLLDLIDGEGIVLPDIHTFNLGAFDVTAPSLRGANCLAGVEAMIDKNLRIQASYFARSLV